MMQRLKKLIHIVLNTIFPWRCLGCHQTGHLVCPKCSQRLEPNLRPITGKEDVWYLFDYHQKIIKDLIWYLKYKQINEVSNIFRPFLKEAVLDLISDDPDLISYTKTNKIILLPVPMWPTKQKKRGLNQAEVLASIIAKEIPQTQIRTDLVIKNKAGQAQVACPNKQIRKKNIKNTFTVKKPNEIKNKIIIIIDDVVTTGATVKEIKKILLPHKPLLVLTLAVAHG